MGEAVERLREKVALSRVFVKDHTRNGHPVKGYWRGLPGLEDITLGRTNIPEVDAVVDDFLDSHLEDWITTDDTIRNFCSDPQQAFGSCQEISDQFTEFARARGLRAYSTNTDLEELGYVTRGKAPGEVLDEKGNFVRDFYHEHTVNEVYLPGRNFPVLLDFTATQYGYDELPKVIGGEELGFL